MHRRKARYRCTAAPCHERNAVPMAQTKDPGNLFRGLGKGCREWTVALERQSVTVEAEQLLTFREHGMRGQMSSQIPLQS